MRFKKLDKALEEIEALGYEVKVFEDPTIFQTDALYKMQTDKYVFYYNQSVNKMDNGRQIVHLNWNGSAKDIIEHYHFYDAWLEHLDLWKSPFHK